MMSTFHFDECTSNSLKVMKRLRLYLNIFERCLYKMAPDVKSKALVFSPFALTH